MLLLANAWAGYANWNATCATRDDPSVWFVFQAAAPPKAAAAGAPASPATAAEAAAAEEAAPRDYDCKGLFFAEVACPNAVGMGKIRQVDTTPMGQAVWELDYLPYGDIQQILVFLDKDVGGVKHEPPYRPLATPAATLPPYTPEELMTGYLKQRRKASAADAGVKLHVWICPDGGFSPPMDLLASYGISIVAHAGKAPL
jgi:hypothetical protein